MAEKTTTAKSTKTVVSPKAKKKALGLRIGAVAAWVVALACEVLAALVLFGKIDLIFMPALAQIIAFLVIDLICVIVGALLWKKANRYDPASKKNKVKFWLWNNMGLIACAFAFIPFIIIALTNKEADKKTKTVAVIAAAVALIIGGLIGVDWNPVSEEEYNSQAVALAGETVYWTQFGSVYHLDEECSHINKSDKISGTVLEAQEAGKGRLCKNCQNRHELSDEDLYGVVEIDEDVEKGNVDDVTEAADVTESADAETAA